MKSKAVRSFKKDKGNEEFWKGNIDALAGIRRSPGMGRNIKIQEWIQGSN